MNINVLSEKEKKVIIDYFINDLSLSKIILKYNLNTSKKTLKNRIEKLVFKIYSYYENFMDLLDVLNIISNNKVFIFHIEKIKEIEKISECEPALIDTLLKYKISFFFLQKINSNIVFKYSKKNRFIIVCFNELYPLIETILNIKDTFITFDEFKSYFDNFIIISDNDSVLLYKSLFKPNLTKIIRYMEEKGIDITLNKIKEYCDMCKIARDKSYIKKKLKLYLLNRYKYNML